MGWEDYHLYAFNIAGVEYGEPNTYWPTDMKVARRVKLDQVITRRRKRITYQYDLGDDWERDTLVDYILHGHI